MIGERGIYTAVEVLENGGIVAIPTETVYGLAANALSVTAITRVFEVKNRPFFDPLICHFSSIEAIKSLVNLTKDQEKLLRALSPGPITLLVPRPEAIPELVTSGSAFMAVRIPAHPLTLELLRRLPFPLAAPSANPFGYLSPTRAAHVRAQLGDSVDFILDGGPASIGVESTVVDLTPSEGFILRPGATTIEQLQAVLPHLAWSYTSSKPSSPQSPGQLDSHYAPHKKIILVHNADDDPGVSLASSFFLGFNQLSSRSYGGQELLSPSGSLGEAAAAFFHTLHEADTNPFETLVAVILPEEGLGRAINDRLRRAASKRE